MSRSYKKNPWICDSDSFMKNYANKRLRRVKVDEEIPDGKAYRKYTCTYDICDWKWGIPSSIEEYLKQEEQILKRRLSANERHEAEIEYKKICAK